MQRAYAIFQEAGVIRAFSLKESVLAHFIANVATNYHNNPYHNLVRSLSMHTSKVMPCSPSLRWRACQ